MSVPKVNEKLLEDLEVMGFPKAQATRALHYSGNTSLEDAINWIVDHENDIDIDEMPLVDVDIEVESTESFPISEEIRIKAQSLREQERKRKEQEEKRLEREREKERIQAGKRLLEAKRIAEENERQRNLSLRKAEKEEEKRARERVLQKLEQDKLNRKYKQGLPSEGQASIRSSATKLQQEKKLNPVYTTTKAEQLRESLRNLKRNHQDRVGSLNGGVEFLELCGFERTGDFLHLPQEKVDMALLNSAGFVLNSAVTNPFFGVLSTTHN
ncbi:UBX domain-containing protein 1-like isoform X2 [Vigna unguiculata]|uniref:UBX domain-containing protein 1-like isoform X2 n=1 Tax=Vigna unguiculata TaxID=3917 RepID=UPI001016464E|nr:UBX domain-containing protein 1-like isoform X2 [Vigna unguiculata]